MPSTSFGRPSPRATRCPGKCRETRVVSEHSARVATRARADSVRWRGRQRTRRPRLGTLRRRPGHSGAGNVPSVRMSGIPNFSGQQANRHRTKTMKTDKTKLDRATARTWKTSTRTARRWRTEGAPLDDAKRMRAWLSSQKHVPDGTRAKLDRPGKVAKAGRSRAHGAEPAGAPGALNRLEQAEVAAWRAFETACESADPVRLKAARRHWLEVTGELRRLDQAVGGARRTGDLVPRKAAEDAIASVLWSLHLHIRGSLPEVCITARRASSDGLAIDAGKQIVDRLLAATVALASDGTFMPALRDAPWASAAIVRGLEDRYGDCTADFVRKNTDWLKAMFAYLAEREGEIALAAVEDRAAKGRAGYLTQRDVHAAVLAACPDVPAK